MNKHFLKPNSQLLLAAAAAEYTIYLIHCHKIIEKLKSGDKFPEGWQMKKDLLVQDIQSISWVVCSFFRFIFKQ